MFISCSCVSVVGAQICSVNKCSFGESNGHTIKFLYFNGRKKPHNFLLALNCFNNQGQDDESDSNEYTELENTGTWIPKSSASIRSRSVGDVKYFLDK